LMTSASAWAGSSAGMMPSPWSAAEGVERLLVGGRHNRLRRTLSLSQVMFRPDSGVVRGRPKSSAPPRIGPSGILQQIGAICREGRPASRLSSRRRDRFSSQCRVRRLPRRNRYLAIVEKRLEQPNRLGRRRPPRRERPAMALPTGLHHLLAELVGRSRLGSRAPSPGRDAGPGGRADQVGTLLSTLDTQSRSASFMASLRVPSARRDRPHFGAEQLHAEYVGFWRSTSVRPM
jgi:hypothetical protein